MASPITPELAQEIIYPRVSAHNQIEWLSTCLNQTKNPYFRNRINTVLQRVKDGDVSLKNDIQWPAILNFCYGISEMSENWTLHLYDEVLRKWPHLKQYKDVNITNIGILKADMLEHNFYVHHDIAMNLIATACYQISKDSALPSDQRPPIEDTIRTAFVYVDRNTDVSKSRRIIYWGYLESFMKDYMQGMRWREVEDKRERFLKFGREMDPILSYLEKANQNREFSVLLQELHQICFDLRINVGVEDLCAEMAEDLRQLKNNFDKLNLDVMLGAVGEVEE